MAKGSSCCCVDIKLMIRCHKVEPLITQAALGFPLNQRLEKEQKERYICQNQLPILCSELSVREPPRCKSRHTPHGKECLAGHFPYENTHAPQRVLKGKSNFQF